MARCGIQFWFFFLFLLAASTCYGTTSIFVITPDGIVAGTDRLSREIRANGPSKSTNTDVEKIELVKGRFIVSTIGINQLTDASGIVYSFTDWIRHIENKVTAETSMTEFIGLVEDEATRTFRYKLAIESQMGRGSFVQSNTLQDTLVEFIVAGYEQGIATIFRVHLQLDWQNKRLIGPIKQANFPVAGQNPNVGLQLYGIFCGISEFSDIHSYAYQRFLSYAPGIMGKFTAQREVTNEEATTAIRVLIGIQAEVTPNQVGSSSRIVVLPVRGVPSVTDMLPLPRANSGQTKKTKS